MVESIAVVPPPRRLGCLVLVTNEAGDPLLVEPAGRPGLVLPGGSAAADESPNEAAARHVFAATGLALDLWQIVAVDYVPKGELVEGLNLVLYGGVLNERRIGTMKPPAPKTRLAGHRFVPLSELHHHVEPGQRQRISQAVRAADNTDARLPLLLRGEPVG
ncbi:hypothetical protein GCM10009760_20850 [Kitasatospora kazusensis]|uniref:Nudix hydrolase domain-containing protein n=1 Tax=Kitasatospora kazusensis TaxID=407974 RepID=A0ABP5KY06_9ACTN